MLPSEKSPKSETGFAVKNSEQKKNRDEVDQSENTFGHTRKSGANPEASEPDAAMLPTLVTTNRTKNPAGDKNAEDWFRHDDSSQKECAAGGEINQTSEKAVPVIAQSFPDQKCEGDGGDDCKSDRQTCGSLVGAKDFAGKDD